MRSGEGEGGGGRRGRVLEDRMGFRGNKRGINRRQQSVNGGLQITYNEGEIITIPKGLKEGGGDQARGIINKGLVPLHVQ